MFLINIRYWKGIARLTVQKPDLLQYKAFDGMPLKSGQYFCHFYFVSIYLIRSRPYQHERFSLDVGSSSYLPCFCFTKLESLAPLCHPVINNTTTDCDSLSCFRKLPASQRYLLPVWIGLLDSLCSLWSLRVIRLITLVLVLWQSTNTHSAFLLFLLCLVFLKTKY